MLLVSNVAVKHLLKVTVQERVGDPSTTEVIDGGTPVIVKDAAGKNMVDKTKKGWLSEIIFG